MSHFMLEIWSSDHEGRKLILWLFYMALTYDNKQNTQYNLAYDLMIFALHWVAIHYYIPRVKTHDEYNKASSPTFSLVYSIAASFMLN